MKKFSYVFLAITISFILFSCSNASQTELESELPGTATSTKAPVSSSTPTVSTRAPYPTLTLYPTSTITTTPTPVTPVQIPISTFEADKAITQTPLPPAQCPPDSANVSFPDLDAINKDQQTFDDTIVEVLNLGGIKEVVSKLSESNIFTITRDDLTHDNVPELIIENRYNIRGYISVFGCDSGEYKKILTVNSVYDYTPSILEIRDMNLNGIPELALVETTCHYCVGVQIFEWNGQEFQSLVRRWYLDPSRNEINFTTIAELDGYADAEIVDTNGDGTYEVVLKGGFPSNISDAYTNGPYRSTTRIFMWDGKYFSLYVQTYSPPEYRFQAIQDGDDETLNGNYEQALVLYQDAIFSDKLKGWSDAEKGNLIAQAEVFYTTSPTPTPLPPHNEDYLQLAAYARYRIVLLHILNKHQSDAQTVYETLQEKFPMGNDGYLYAEMAKTFWQEYLSSTEIGLACQKAVDYADKHREILKPLGGPEFGFWSKQYLPVDVCPFTSQ